MTAVPEDTYGGSVGECMEIGHLQSGPYVCASPPVPTHMSGPAQHTSMPKLLDLLPDAAFFRQLIVFKAFTTTGDDSGMGDTHGIGDDYGIMQ